MSKFNQSPTDPNKEAGKEPIEKLQIGFYRSSEVEAVKKEPKTERKIGFQPPQRTTEQPPQESAQKPEEKIVETKKTEGGLKTVKEKAIEELALAEKYGLKPPEKREEGPEKKIKAEKPKEEAVFEQKETELRERLERERNNLAAIDAKDEVKYAFAMMRYRQARNNLKNAIFERKTAELKNAPKEQADTALSSLSVELFEKLYIEEAQNLKDRKLEIKAEQQKDPRIGKFIYKIADGYRKLPFKHKLLVYGGLALAGTSVGVGVPLAATALSVTMAGLRMVGGLGTTIVLETEIKKFQEKRRKGNYERLAAKLKEDFKKDIEVEEKREEKTAKILNALEAKGEELDEKLNKLSKKEKRGEALRYITAGALGVAIGSGAFAMAFKELLQFLKPDWFHAPPIPEKLGGVRLPIGEQGPEGAVIDYLKGTGVPEATAGKQAHLMFLEFMKSPEVSKFMAEKGMAGNKEAYLELMRLIKKGAVEIAPDGKLKLADMEYVSDAFRKAMKAAGENALEVQNAAKVGAELAAQETYRTAEDAFYAGKTTDYYKALENYYTQTGKPRAAEMYAPPKGGEFWLNPPPGDVETDWKFIHGLSHLSKEEYAIVKDLKVGEVLKKTYWGMTDETRFPVAGERDHLELWRKMGLRNKIMEMASKLPDEELQKAQGMNVHDFLKEHYIEPQVEAVKAESVAEIIKPPVGAEAPLGGAEAGAVEKAAGVVHDKIIENTELGVKGIFKYAPDGKIEKLIVSGSENASEASKLLQDNWREVLRGGKLTASLDRSVIESRAVTILQHQEILKTMEEVGRGDSAEADFIRKSIQKTIELTEKKYGDVFK